MPGLDSADLDWGDADWEVDKKADSLHKALFGKISKSKSVSVRADADLDEANVFADSDDEADEKLSRKAKKKLKERKRKENKRNRLENGGEEQQTANSQVGGDGKQKPSDSKKSAVAGSKVSKGGDKDVDISKGVSEGQEDATGEDKPKRIRVRKRNRKKSSTAETDENGVVTNAGDGGKVTKTKKSLDGENKSEEGEGEEEKPKKKRKRVKKKKPNSKKNKYAHLGRKGEAANTDGDEEDDSDQASEEVVAGSGKKRQRSVSPDTASKKRKKIKLANSDKETDESLTTKKKKKRKIKSGNAEEDDNEEEEEKMEVDATPNKKSKKSNKRTKKETLPIVEPEYESKEIGEADETKPTADKKKKLSRKEKLKQKESEGSKASISPFAVSGQGSELQQKVTDKLASARFRFINEQLYTIKGGEALRMFKQDSTLMEAYHTGFQGQAKHWSVNPLDVIIRQINTKAPNLVIADFGCGEAKLSTSIKQKVHSFDLYAINNKVTVCDMAKTPLPPGSVDIAVFCLSLMGTNLNDYLLEANRVLKDGGLLKIAEVVSRFSDANKFIKSVSALGFKAVNSRDLSAMFYLMDFKKAKNVEKTSKHSPPISLKPCVYKKR